MIELKPDLDLVERWMQQWHGIPVLVAIRINTDTGIKSTIEGKCFIKPGCPADGDPAHTDMLGLRRWIWERQGNGAYWSNIYFHPNTLRRPMDAKASVSDVGALTTLHVDIDCGAGEDQETGIARIVELLKRLRDKDGNPALPSDIITSGGGAQAYWRLGAPVPINGDQAIADDLKLYNKHIEGELVGDHCHSLDHIMRMPGTVNIPDEKKRAMGRVPRLAQWPYHDENKRYSLGQFKKAEPENKAATARAFARDGDIKYSLEQISVDDKRIRGLDKKWITLGVEGDTLNEYLGADGKLDRSGMCLAFVTACMRCSPPVDDDVIAAILMDNGWKIGECIRDKGSTVKRHLNRIIARAHKFVGEDMEKPPVLGENKWLDNARQFTARKFAEGICYWRGDWYVYKRGVYLVHSESWMKAQISNFLGDAVLPDTINENTKQWTFKPFNPCNNDVNEMYGAMTRTAYVDDDLEQPCWLGLGDEEEYPPPEECINLRNGILHVPTRTLIDHTPDYFSSSIAEFDYDAEMQCPVWRETLAQYWPEDGALELMLLQEMFGYSLTPWTTLQKLFAVVGPGRSGKGTIGRVLTLLVGKRNIAAPTFKSLGTDFGRQALICKLLAIIGEAMFGIRDDIAEVTNFLKTVSGEDTVNIPRKYQLDWEGRLKARFWMFCNQIPDFRDAGKALMMRLVPLKMTRSFEANPDIKLGAKLEREIAGILNWSLEGYDRLTKNEGQFTMPEASTETKKQFGRLASPLISFLEDFCIIDATGSTPLAEVFMAYENWCEVVNMKPMGQGRAIEAIIGLEPARIKRTRLQEKDKERHWVISGLVLRNKPTMPKRRSGGHGSSGGNRAESGQERFEGDRGDSDRGAPEIPF